MAKILDSAKLVLCGRSKVLNLFLDDYGLGEGLLDALVMDRFSHAIEQALLAVAE